VSDASPRLYSRPASPDAGDARSGNDLAPGIGRVVVKKRHETAINRCRAALLSAMNTHRSVRAVLEVLHENVAVGDT
jgi:hypothetical protein